MLYNEIMELLKKYAKEDDEYINPHFLFALTELLCDYSGLEDEEVDQWVQDMWSH